jgi:aspartate carbamoyltransferase regulatory subunit
MAGHAYRCPNPLCIGHTDPSQATVARHRVPLAEAELFAIQCTHCGYIVHIDDPKVIHAMMMSRADGSMGYAPLPGKPKGP